MHFIGKLRESVTDQRAGDCGVWLSGSVRRFSGMLTDERAKYIRVRLDLEKQLYSKLARFGWILQLEPLQLVDFLREQIRLIFGHIRGRRCPPSN
jgi:hypothetical protein